MVVFVVGVQVELLGRGEFDGGGGRGGCVGVRLGIVVIELGQRGDCRCRRGIVLVGAEFVRARVEGRPVVGGTIESSWDSMLSVVDHSGVVSGVEMKSRYRDT